MRHLRRGAAVSVATVAMLAVAGCSADEDTSPAAGSTSSPGVYGTPADSSAPDPTDVATDPEVSTGPVERGSLQVTFADWNAEAGAVQVSAILPGVVESGGTCTLTLTKAGDTVTATVDGTPDARSTSCGGLAVPGADLSSGTWDAVVTYRSVTSDASSRSTEVVVP